MLMFSPLLYIKSKKMAKTLQRILLFFSLVLIYNILKNVKILYSPVV